MGSVPSYAAPFLFSPDVLAFLPIVGAFLIFYFVLLRPQQRKAQRHEAMLRDLQRGDRVICAGGIVGQIVRILHNHDVEVEISPNVKIKVLKTSISGLLNTHQDT